jgi:DNA (cytosine-5)-methyltransferase 1
MLTHIDLFAGGAAGFALGLSRAGFRTVAAVERDANCVASYRANNPATPVAHADIREVRCRDLVRLLPAEGHARRPADLLTAGFPCETWSSARNKPAAPDDPRRTLYREVVRLAEAVQARCVLLENVCRITAAETFPGSGRLVIHEIRSALEKAGYENQIEASLDAAGFGAATRRRRWFLLAALDPRLKLRAPTPKAAGRPRTVRDALASLPLDPCETHGARDGIPSWHVAPRLRAATVARSNLVRSGRRVWDLVREGDSDAVAALQGTRVLPRRPYRQRGLRLRWDRPAPTLTAHCGEELVHPAAHRNLTPRECLRIMGYGDEHQLRGPLTTPHGDGVQNVYGMIGDSVCPQVAKAWGEVLKEILA